MEGNDRLTATVEEEQQVAGINPDLDYFIEHNILFALIDEVALDGKTPYDFM